MGRHFDQEAEQLKSTLEQLSLLLPQHLEVLPSDSLVETNRKVSIAAQSLTIYQ